MALTLQQLEKTFDSYAVGALSAMLKARDSSAKITGKPRIVAALIAVLGDETGTRAAFEKLSPQAKVTLRILREQGGKCTVGALKAAASASGLAHFDDNLYQLMKRALVFYATPMNGKTRHDLWGKPITGYSYRAWRPNLEYEIEALEAALELADESIELPPAHGLEPYQGEPYFIEEQSPATLLHVLFNIVRWASEREIVLTKTTNTLRKADVKALDNLLKEQSDLMGFALALALNAFLLHSKGDRITPNSHASDFFQLAPREQVGKLLEAWQRMENWSEFFQIAEIESSTYTVPREAPNSYNWNYEPCDIPIASALTAARVFFLGLLKRAGKNGLAQWQSFDSLLALVKAENAEFLIPASTGRPSYYRSSTRDNPTARYYEGFWPRGQGRFDSKFERDRDWNLVEGRFVRQMLAVPLHWLGLVAIARDENGEMVAFRLSPLGAHLLGLSDELPALETQPETEKPLIIQPNFEIIAYTEPQHLRVLYELERLPPASAPNASRTTNWIGNRFIAVCRTVCARRKCASF